MFRMKTSPIVTSTRNEYPLKMINSLTICDENKTIIRKRRLLPSQFILTLPICCDFHLLQKKNYRQRIHIHLKRFYLDHVIVTKSKWSLFCTNFWGDMSLEALTLPSTPLKKRVTTTRFFKYRTKLTITRRWQYRSDLKSRFQADIHPVRPSCWVNKEVISHSNRTKAWKFPCKTTHSRRYVTTKRHVNTSAPLLPPPPPC